MDDSNHLKIVKAMTWAQNRLLACQRTMRERPRGQSHDWAYGESVAIAAMLRILDGEDP